MIKVGINGFGRIGRFVFRAAMERNVIDMAVGVVIGGAFGKIVSSLVANVIMPPIGLLVGGVNFTDLKWVMKAAEIGADGKEIAPAGNLLFSADEPEGFHCFDSVIHCASSIQSKFHGKRGKSFERRAMLCL